MTAHDPLDALADAVVRAHRRPDPVDAIAEAVTAVFADRTPAARASDDWALRNADLVTRHRALRARMEARHGPASEWMAMMASRGGLSARFWC